MKLAPRVTLAAFLLWALVVAAPGLLPGLVLLPMDLLSDLGAWKPRADERVGVSNRLLSDPVLQFAPWDSFARRSLARREIPWVNPHQGTGRPFLANPQTALFSPLTWPRLVLGDAGWGLTVFLKVLVAALGARAFARRLGAGETESLFSGLVYAASGFTVVWGLHPLTNVSVFLPWLGAMLLDLVRAPSRGSVAGAVTAAALATAGGHPETLFFGVAGLAAFLAWETLGAARRGTPLSWRNAAVAASAAAFGFLVLGLVTVPFLHLLPGSFGRSAREAAPPRAFRPAAAVAQVVPGFLGSPLERELDLTGVGAKTENFNERSGGYVGAVVLVLLALSYPTLGRSFRRGLLVGVVALLFAWRVPPTAHVLARLPGFSMAANERLVVVFVLFAAAAAGTALKAVASGPPRRKAGIALGLFGLGLAAAGVVPSVPAFAPLTASAAREGIARLRSTGRLQKPASVYEERLHGYLRAGRFTAVRRLTLPGLCLVAAGAALAVRSRARLELLGGAALLELALFGLGYLPAVARASIPDEPPSIRDVRKLDPGSRFLLAATPGLFPPDLATLYGLRDIRSFDVLETAADVRELVAAGYDEASLGFREPVGAETAAFLSRRGVRFVLSRSPVAGGRLVGGDVPPAVGVYELPGAAPSAPPPNRPPEGAGLGLATTLVGIAGALVLAAVTPPRPTATLS